MSMLRIVFGVFLCLQIVAAQASEPLERALRATCRIYGGNASGTAFLVSTRDSQDQAKEFQLLVTAAHVLDDLPGAEATLVLRTEGDHGEWRRQEVAVAIRRGEEPLWKRHESEDVAALRISLPSDVDVSPLTYDCLATETAAVDREVFVGQDVFIPSFPAKLEANPAGWPVVRRGSIASYPIAPLASAKTLLVDMRIFGGDSGAPVIAAADDSLLIVALISGMHRQTDTIATPFEERTVHTPLGLAIAVQAPIVRATIDELLKE